jgi:predicted transcriptional regulator
MNNQELDTIFSVLENPIRRKILAKLAKEQHYPLQLSKELNISQQAIMKHLKVLEDHNLVQSFEEKSTLGGPPRKSYVSNKHISLRIDIGPRTFNSEVYDYTEVENDIAKKEDKPDKVENGEVIAVTKHDETKDLETKFIEVLSIDDQGKKLTELSKIIQELNSELDEIKIKRAKLLNMREKVAEESNRIIGELCREYDERKIMYYFINNTNRDISIISEALELREKVIMDIFRHLMKQRILIDFEDDFFGI